MTISNLHNPPNNFNPTPFRPPFWLKNAHLQTILPKFMQPKVPTYRRVIKQDSLAESDVAYDFYDAHSIEHNQLESYAISNHDRCQKGTKDKTPLIVLFHGMEGSSHSHYARTLAQQMHANGWHFVVAHFRSCGGIPASGRVFYNAGDTGEVQHTLQNLAKDYVNIYAIGVSLGGNALAKYLGEYGADALCKGAVVVSAPVDMASAAYAMQSFMSRRIYSPYLLNPIIKKALANTISEAELVQIKAIKRISDFDHIFTAPRHGYRSNIDYYHRASALPYLLSVSCPLLLISAKDDPFIGFTATPNDVSDSVTILDTEHGGHIGYLRYKASDKLSDKLSDMASDKVNDQANNRVNKNGKLQNFDINWIPETVTAYFKAIGIESASTIP